MDRQPRGNRLHFHDYRAFHEQVQPVCAIERDAFVGKWDPPLCGEGHFARGQLVLKTRQVGGLEQTWAEHTMDFNRSRNDVPRGVVERRRCQHADRVSKRGAVRVCGLFRQKGGPR